MVDTNGILGCCVAQNIYNIGSAHMVERAKNLDDFKKRFADVHPYTFNQIYLNSDQWQEQEWLLECGFEKVFEIGSVALFMANYNVMNNLRTEGLKIRKKEQEAKRLAREKRLRELEQKKAKELKDALTPDTKAA